MTEIENWEAGTIAFQENEDQMILIVGVRLPHSSKVYYFNPSGLTLRVSDTVVVETDSGEEYGEVALAPQEVAETFLASPLKAVLRIATSTDVSRQEEREDDTQKKQEAMAIAEEKILAHGLDMKVVDMAFSFDGNKITFYFTADGRVDFRALVRDLASVFRARIELRQIGVRDEARLVGGLGNCGREVCCRAFMKEFHPVSIKMAKEQSLSLNPTKISGVCGRLMCCLQYEQSTYEAIRRDLPRVGKDVYTPDGQGKVIKVMVIAERVRVRVANLEDDGYQINEYHIEEISTKHPVPLRQNEETVDANDMDFTLSTFSKEEGQGEREEKKRPPRKRSRPQGNSREASGTQKCCENTRVQKHGSDAATDASRENDASHRKRNRRGGRSRNHSEKPQEGKGSAENQHKNSTMKEKRPHHSSETSE